MTAALNRGFRSRRKHAPGASARVEIRHRDSGLHVLVENEPATVNGSPPRPAGTGRGIVGMRERCGLLGGELTAGPRAGGGFEVKALLPLAQAR